MKEWWFPTAFSMWGDEERAAIDRVLTSGRFTQGEEVEAFEREFADFHGRAYGIMVNSGSSANLVAVAALVALGRLKAGHVAIVPAIAWSTTYAPLVQHGIDLVLADVDHTWNADPFARPLTRVQMCTDANLIVACSILGNPAYLADWENAAGIMGAAMIEDNCESLGASLGGRSTGTFGDMSTFSFFYSHQLSAIEGGMILTDDGDLADRCRMLRAHGWTRDVWQKGYAPDFAEEYDFHLFGYNVRALELHAAIARVQLKRLPEFIYQRQRNASLFSQMVAEADPPIVLQTTHGDPSPFGLQFTVNAGSRHKVVQALRASSIDCRLPTGGSFRMHEYGKRWLAQETPRADHVHQFGLFLGNGPLALDEKIARAVSVIKEAL